MKCACEDRAYGLENAEGRMMLDESVTEFQLKKNLSLKTFNDEDQVGSCCIFAFGRCCKCINCS